MLDMDFDKLIMYKFVKVSYNGYHRQNYYHYTDYRNFMNIIIMDELKEGNIKGISLTRDKFLHKHTDYLPTDIRFELNGDLLNNIFKIKPFMDNNMQTKDGVFTGKKWKGNPEIDYDFLEFEERVMSDKIKPLSKYLVNISIGKHFFDEIIKNTNFIEYINNHNISFNLLK